MNRKMLVLMPFLVLAGCATSTAPTFTGVLREPGANFTLIVSNQSFRMPVIDVIVSVDGRTIVSGRLRVMNQHHWEFYDIRLPEGAHVLHAEAAGGSILFDTDFEVSEKRCKGLLSFWGPSRGATGSRKYEFTFEQNVCDGRPMVFL